MVIDLTVLRPTPTTPRIATLCRRHLGAMPLSEPPRPHRSTGRTARVLPMVYMSNRVDTSSHAPSWLPTSGKTYRS